ncbi:hypothetical protein BDV24DRAFT_147245 [Aspergillus arachidicola]|uniref:Carrier domain-containing protein n=1 Tax=Aspergillus arachidicola TaxID=656916 RepID=A0A5N6YRB3_9EURO|nr:hypothetical protein BDV24DRAFT_147245 [Aspergillus arachidicola]
MLTTLDWDFVRVRNFPIPPTANTCIHALIDAQCKASPEAEAVCAWDGKLTYDELDRFSACLAAELMVLGVGPDQFVPVLFEKSKWTPVALLAVLRAGGAFVMLDPSHPKERLRDICDQAQASLIVCSDSLQTHSLQLITNVVTMGYEKAAVWSKLEDVPVPKSAVQPHHAVYAVFTSGSTGTPKGVVIEQSSWTTSALSLQGRLKVTASTRALIFASHAFDSSITDYLTTFLAGGCVCIPSESQRWNNLPEAVRQFQANWMQITPSVARLLKPTEIPTIKTLVLSGEALKSEDIDRWAHCVHLLNAYGPSECSVICSINGHVEPGSDPDNIGFASGAVFWVVDQNNINQLVPIGAIGELIIEGPVVGRCYLNDDERTQASFIDRPAWLQQLRAQDQDQAPIYRTGDLVRYQADGSLKYIGRKDSQIKLHGQRIELDETDRRQLREEASKLSWNDLLGISTKTTVKKYPSTKGEYQVQRLCADILGYDVDDVGMDDDFFHLGGDSIAAMKLTSNARLQGLSITVLEIFENPILSSLAQILRPLHFRVPARTVTQASSMGDTNHLDLDDLDSPQLGYSRDEIVALMPATECQFHMANKPPVYWFLDIDEPLDVEMLRVACETLIQRHAILRTVFTLSGEQPIQVILKHVAVTVNEVSVQGEDAIAAARSWSCRDSDDNPPYVDRPQIAFALVQGDGNSPQHVLIIKLSHAQYDGWCLQTLFQDLLGLYHDIQVSVPLEFAEYSSFCHNTLKPWGLSYWQSLLGGSTVTPALPSSPMRNSDSVSRILSSKSLPLVDTPSGISMATIGKAAWATVLARWHRLQDVVFGQLVTGRNIELDGVEHVVGCCINYIPVRIKLHKPQSVLELLHQVQSQHLQAMPYETVEFGAIAKRLDWPSNIQFGALISALVTPIAVLLQVIHLTFHRRS